MIEPQLNDVQPADAADVEKVHHKGDHDVRDQAGRGKPAGLRDVLARALSASPIEARGVMPVPEEERNSTRYVNYFFIWFSMNSNLLP
jgi:hypothetical protein